MLRIAHIINPVPVGPSSDLYVAQPVTFASMVAARDFARDVAQIELLAVMLIDEDVALPADFRRLPSLARSVQDVAKFEELRRLPLLDDILRSASAATEAEYLIYTNVDIGVQPHFYAAVAALIRDGYDGFAINRRTIRANHHTPADLPLMCAEVGEAHAGYDCFVFRREALRGFKLANMCVGTGWIGRAMIANVAANSVRFEVFRNLHLTFHLGNDRFWARSGLRDYRRFNLLEFDKALTAVTSGPVGQGGEVLRRCRNEVDSALDMAATEYRVGEELDMFCHAYGATSSAREVLVVAGETSRSGLSATLEAVRLRFRKAQLRLWAKDTMATEPDVLKLPSTLLMLLRGLVAMRRSPSSVVVLFGCDRRLAGFVRALTGKGRRIMISSAATQAVREKVCTNEAMAISGDGTHVLKG